MVTELVALFGAGVASFLAPCLVPLLPAYLGMLAGEAADGTVDGAVDGAVDGGAPGRAVVATLVFVLGFAVVFAGLGAAAGVVGSSLRGVQDGVQRVGGVIVVIMGLALLGWVRGPLSRERRLMARLPAAHGPLRPFVVGVAFGAAWSPCVGPLLAAALTVAARSGQAGRGALLLLSYSLGIGLPFVLLSLSLASFPALSARLRRIGPRMEQVAGGLLVLLGVLLASGTYSHLTSYLARFTPAVGGL